MLIALFCIQTSHAFCQINQYHQINARISLILNKESMLALKSGIDLHFQRQIRMQSNPFIFSRRLLEEKHYTLRYDNLSHSVSLEEKGQAGQRKNFNNVEAALIDMGHIQDYLLKKEKTHRVSIRLALNKQQLPTSLRLSTLFDSTWNIDSGWQECLMYNP